MRNAFFLFLFISNYSLGQCDQTTSVIFSNDSEITEFIETNQECKVIHEILCVGPNLFDLSPLSFFDTIKNLLILGNPHVKNLDFLNATTIPSSIYFDGLDSLNSISGIEGSPIKIFSISNCPSLNSINLPNGSYNSIVLDTEPLKVNVDSLIADNIVLVNNIEIIKSGKKLRTRYLSVGANPIYNSFESLYEVFELDTLKGLVLHNFDEFDFKGFPDLMICNNFAMGNIRSLKSIELNNKSAVVDFFQLNNIGNIKNLSAFENFTVQSLVSIESLDSLITIDGMSWPDSLFALKLINNQLLSDINPLKQIATITALKIENNQNLDSCSIAPVCKLLNSNYNPILVSIDGNNANCNSIQTVLDSCDKPIECIDVKLSETDVFTLLNYNCIRSGSNSNSVYLFEGSYSFVTDENICLSCPLLTSSTIGTTNVLDYQITKEGENKYQIYFTNTFQIENELIFKDKGFDANIILSNSVEDTYCFNINLPYLSCKDTYECHIEFLGVKQNNSNLVTMPFEIFLATSDIPNCDAQGFDITFTLDGKMRKQVYKAELYPNDEELQHLEFNISTDDLLNENFDCMDIEVYNQCSEESCYDYICQILNRNYSKDKDDFYIYPNPSSQYITITSENNFVSEIFDINGKSVQKINVLTGTFNYDISKLSAGIYFIQHLNSKFSKLIVY